MEDVMTAIVRLVNDKKDHIPPINTSHLLTFPFDITISGYVMLCFVTWAPAL